MLLLSNVYLSSSNHTHPHQDQKQDSFGFPKPFLGTKMKFNNSGYKKDTKKWIPQSHASAQELLYSMILFSQRLTKI